ncbi:M23 family metallopeptidase [Balneolaceae bacterium YR4-1]|uniref:M23 family metallopeptidase n=1 Tax=Halalkalibaculum roseum TaxID=2709311 RepID=A0A6M1T5V3_9BACT|nr:M23 family metallopeptidase [Halalkalibaculum roseum]NGP77365.1 M23 family metallopeptidase [Halalkalibaculum roseum]
MKSVGSHSPTRKDKVTVLSIFVFLLFAVLDTMAFLSYYPTGKSLDVSFPLRSGTYYVLQGGASIVTNPFHAQGSNKLAIDIIKLNSLGNRADGIAPQALKAYQIFEENLYSPCQGRILKVRNNLQDNPPGNPDTEHPEGNYITLKCLMGDILMAHLRRGSIKVAPGDTVTIGQPLAEIGNSGNTLEPHLHIEATKDGKPLWLRFNGLSLSINSLIKK